MIFLIEALFLTGGYSMRRMKEAAMEGYGKKLNELKEKVSWLPKQLRNMFDAELLL